MLRGLGCRSRRSYIYMYTDKLERPSGRQGCSGGRPFEMFIDTHKHILAHAQGRTDVHAKHTSASGATTEGPSPGNPALDIISVLPPPLPALPHTSGSRELGGLLYIYIVCAKATIYTYTTHELVCIYMFVCLFVCVYIYT